MNKKFIIINIFIVFLFLLIFLGFNILEFSFYNQNNNLFLNNLVGKVLEKNPNVTREEIIDLLNTKNLSDTNILKEYGINLENDSLVYQNEKIIKISLIINIFLIILLISIIFFLFYLYNKKRKKKLKEIEAYLENINLGNYKLDIDTNTEEDLSILKNEIYKITVMLKENALIMKNDKLLLKSSLEDLSHQLKTPLTSIILKLDNISEANLEVKERKYVKDIKREIQNINFLINNLLKLSKFDANTIEFINTKFKLKDLIIESIKNVEILADLKNIEIIVSGNLENTMIGDFKWQIESLTNILKNCIEYSKENSKIEIMHEENKLYSKIIVKDYGNGMTHFEAKHIFDRFYKGKNSNSDSVGIGLSLAKTIIEHNNGYIKVNSKIGVGTTFIIKYVK